MTTPDLFGPARELTELWLQLQPGFPLREGLRAVPTLTRAICTSWSAWEAVKRGKLVPVLQDRKEAYRQLGQLGSGVLPAGAFVRVGPFLLRRSHPSLAQRGFPAEEGFPLKREEGLPPWLGWILGHEEDVIGAFVWARDFVRPDAAINGPKADLSPLRFGRENAHYWHLCQEGAGQRPFERKGALDEVDKVLRGLLRPDWVDQYRGMILHLDSLFTAVGPEGHRRRAKMRELAEGLLAVEEGIHHQLFPPAGRPLPFIVEVGE